ncbi:bifunctional UDP-N-acetylglucosamine diphosphorylase/glucosamine-1-phosphate N-acetyltransferase GlmU [Orrella marina]|uniref:Bifunctional protein GlmU n=1 Tax=Orrella marina TaxID=2163011 RepID=A0A2R4XM97_9BURK|nr:bifunctional UDP-N-acetylglucosamine diphosphorylase/glucosamine-1-phosphate N-acetyltransferase GlmU [Orrella marina]AWB34922.1 UDP-N-acetylglucosamine diphosphorylase/glucosamine-1-phosphate N-acetyltransferase [Orrella marina]
MLNIVILAAGMGKRMKSGLPKVLHPIAGRPMLSHLLETARSLNPDRLFIVVGHGAERVKAEFEGQSDLRFVLQAEQLGTGHAVQQVARDLVEEGEHDQTLVLYGDVPLVQSGTLRALLAASEDSLALLTEELPDPAGYGRIVRDHQGRVTAIVEHKDATPSQLAIREVNTGMLVAPTASLKSWLGRLQNNNAQGEYYLTDIIGMAVSECQVVATVEPQKRFETLGVNSRSQQADLERLWQRELAERQMIAGVTLADPDRFDQRGALACGQDVSIDVGCVFEGTVTLGDRVVIGPNCLLKDVVVADDVTINAFSHLQGAKVGSSAVVGPFARLRPGSDLGEKSHVGNFVEIKNATLGHGSKANHLSYLGDAQIGARVNIGAGTITCNYDGVNKHLTVIEDDAFIGSDTQLVAPVKVGAGATLGAGTTLTMDAPRGKLTISRSLQKTIEQWQRPVKQGEFSKKS